MVIISTLAETLLPVSLTFTLGIFTLTESRQMPFIQIPGLHIHYEHAGEGDEVLILVHGNFASWRWWQPLLEDMPSGYRAYAPDLRGCGDTEKPEQGYTIEQLAEDLQSFIQALETPRFHLLGHSMGGAVALQYALDQCQHLVSLILLAPAPAEGLSTSTEHHFGLADILSSDALSRWLPTLALHRPVMNRAINRVLPGLSESTELQSLLVEDALRMSPLALTGFMQALNHWNIQPQLGRITVPVLILGGAQDPLIHPPALARTADGLPNAQLIIWPNTGHAPQLEHPEHFRDLLLNFLQRPTEPVTKTPEPQAEPTHPGILRKLWNQFSDHDD